MLLLFTLAATAQEQEEEYISEFTWGVTKNTNSGLIGGIAFKLGRLRAERTYTTYGLEIVNVQHPKELKYRSPVSSTAFVWGKQNYLYSLRGQYGRETLLFRKAPKHGVQISSIFAGGPTIGIVSPYYVLANGRYEPFSPQRHSTLGSIQGSGKLFQGLGESELAIGANVKAGLSFEFGPFQNSVAGIEVGTALEAFTKEIIIVPTQDNRAVFSSLYFTLYWGTRR